MKSPLYREQALCRGLFGCFLNENHEAGQNVSMETDDLPDNVSAKKAMPDRIR